MSTGETIVISCKTNDPTAKTQLLVSPVDSEVYVPTTDNPGRITSESQLFTIAKITAGDEGKYKCVAEKGDTEIELFKGTMAIKGRIP